MIKNDKLKSDINLGMLIGQVHRLSTKKFVQNSHNSGLDISMDQWIVLGPIWENEGISHKEISEYCLKDKTSVTKIIDTLEKKNLVVRVPDQLDHRVKRVVLSNKGKELFLPLRKALTGKETGPELKYLLVNFLKLLSLSM